MTDTRDDLYERLREGKRTLRNQRRAMSLVEKVEQVVELQRLVLPAMRADRRSEPWKRVWDLGSTAVEGSKWPEGYVESFASVPDDVDQQDQGNVEFRRKL